MCKFYARRKYQTFSSLHGFKTKIYSVSKNAIMQKLVRYWFDAADGVVFQTEDAKMFFCSSVQNKSSIIYNSVSNQFFRENVSNDTTGIVAFGRLVDQKTFQC